MLFTEMTNLKYADHRRGGVLQNSSHLSLLRHYHESVQPANDRKMVSKVVTSHPTDHVVRSKN